MARKHYIDNLDALALRMFADQAKAAFERRNKAYTELRRLEETSGVADKRAQVHRYELEERQALAKMQQLINAHVPPLPTD